MTAHWKLTIEIWCCFPSHLVIETFQTHFIFQKIIIFNYGFLAKFPGQKNNESENLANVTSWRNEKQIYLQIGIMGWNDGTCMKKRIIEPNFIPSLREISTSFFPFSCPPPTFSFHIVKGPLPPLLTPLLLLSNASKAIKDLFLYMETTSLQNNMNLMRKWGTMAIPMYFELKFGQTNNLGCFSFVCSLGRGFFPSFPLSWAEGKWWEANIT